MMIFKVINILKYEPHITDAHHFIISAQGLIQMPKVFHHLPISLP